MADRTGDPKQPEGMTPTNFVDFLEMTQEGVEAEEHEASSRFVNERLKGPLTPLEKDDLAYHEEATYGYQRGIRSGVVLMIVVLAMIAAGSAWVITRGGGGDAKPSVLPGAPTTVEAAGGSPAVAPDGSVPLIDQALVGAWVCTDGDFGYEFLADGTYRFASLDSESTGHYRISNEDGHSHLVLVDPGDPTGMTASMIGDYRFDGGSMWLTLLGTETEMVRGDLPVPGDTAPPVATLDAASASSLNGRIEGEGSVTIPGLTTGVSQTVDVSSATGSITIDAVSGEVSGRLEAHFECSTDRCDQPGETAIGDIVIDVLDTRPSTYMQDTWAYEGNAHVRVVFNATSVIAEQSAPWSWVEDLDATYTVGMEREWAVFDLNLRISDTYKVIALQVIGPTS